MNTVELPNPLVSMPFSQTIAESDGVEAPVFLIKIVNRIRLFVTNKKPAHYQPISAQNSLNSRKRLEAIIASVSSYIFHAKLFGVILA